MKTVIVFREGQSGNFLKSIILKNNLNRVSFRMPESYSESISLTHEVSYEKHKSEFDLVLRILPSQRIYSAVYNNFMKKLVLEEYSTEVLDTWHDNPVYWHDRCYYNIVEYHALITKDIKTNCYSNVIDFDQLLNRDYLENMLEKYFKLEFDTEREQIRKSYEALQLPLDLDQPRTSMKDIVQVINDELLMKNPWFFSYCLHKYEISNGFSEDNRHWSINDIHEKPTKNLLLTLAQQYRLD